ncbi:MFS transporter [soil metagenome]
MDRLRRIEGGLGGNYWKLWSASAVSNLSDGIFFIALPLLALRLTDSPALIAGVAIAGRLPWLFFVLIAGALADRLDRRRTMINVDLLRVLVLGGLAIGVPLDLVTIPMLYVTAFVLGIGETFFDTAAQSVMPSIVSREQLSRANGRLYAVELSMNQFIGPPIGGLLAATGIALAFAGSAAGYLLAALSLFFMRGSFRPQRTGPPKRLHSDIVEGLRYLWGHRLLRTLAAMVGVMNLGFTAAFAVFVLYAVAPGPLGLSELGFGILSTMFAVGSVAGSILTERAERLLGRSRLLFACVAGSAVSLAVPAVTSSVVAVGAAFVVGGAATVMWNVITVSLRQGIVPDELLGRVNAGYRLLAWGTMPIGAALGGLIGELVSLEAVFAVSAGITALLLLARPIVTDEAIRSAEAEGERRAAAAAGAAAF